MRGLRVDVFFLLSGYIMASICDGNSPFSFRRRLIRVAPPYWALTLLLFVFALHFPGALLTTRPDKLELLKSLFFVPFMKSPGYLQPLAGFYVSIALFRRHPLIFAATVMLAVAVACRLLGHGGALALFYGRPLALAGGRPWWGIPATSFISQILIASTCWAAFLCVRCLR